MKIKSTILAFYFLVFQICFFLFVKLAQLIFTFLPLHKMYKKNGTVFLEIFPEENAGYIYRVKKWEEVLNKDGIKANSFLVYKDKDKFYYDIKNRFTWFLIRFAITKFIHVIKTIPYKNVIVRREILMYNDYGNLFMEKFLLKINPNAILDFDDDIASAKREPKNISRYGKILLESKSKFTESLKLYNHFIVGSKHLSEKLLQNNPKANFIIIPTCVDYYKIPPKKYEKFNPDKKIVFGWIGTDSNQVLLNNIITPLNKLSKKVKFKLLVISGKKYSNSNAEFEIENINWSYRTQIDDLKKIDIGLMPLNYREKDKGKCGFKLIQYMGLGIVSIASSVTINKEIIPSENHGFLVDEESNEWLKQLCKATVNKNNFELIGEKARTHIENNFSFNCHKENFKLFLN